MEIKKRLKVKTKEDYLKLQLMFECGSIRSYERINEDSYSVIFRISDEEKDVYRTNSLKKLFEIEKSKNYFLENFQEIIRRKKEEIKTLEELLN